MRVQKAFTLVEILIVVVILGVLAAIVVPQFTRSTKEASSMATLDQLLKIRSALSIYYVRNHSHFPEIVEDTGLDAWGQLTRSRGEYLRSAPNNMWVPGAARERVIFRDTPDAGYQTTHGWIYNPLTGDLWAGSFDANDKPFPQP